MYEIFKSRQQCNKSSKYAGYIVFTIVALFALLGCSGSQSPQDFSRIIGIKSSTPTGINSIRLTSLKQTARGLGAQAGLAWRSKQINSLLRKQTKNLNKIFDFNYLVMNHNVIPPVLAEGRNTLNLADEYTVRISDRNYEIIAPPRFVTAPPNWQNYIWLQYKKPEIPNATLIPKNANERAVWNEYTRIGWNEGVSQADEIFSANLGRLSRDFQGMVLYRKLLAQNMVTPPFVSQADLGVTGGGSNLRINDRVLRITAISELKANSKTWNPQLTEDKDGEIPKIVIPPTKKGNKI
jgi:defect in organelle trafficking protein DotC